MSKAFYVYTHARPDGSIFYVGKGHGQRAYDFAPSRRTIHHLNILRKYGRDALIITLFPQESEEAAFSAERELIAKLRADGVRLINLTDGGEGASGREQNEAQKAAFAKGRGKDRKLSDDAKRRIAEACRRGNAAASAWRKTEEGQAHIRRLGQISAEATACREKRIAICPDCGAEFATVSFKARFCSKLCQQRARRKIEKQAKAELPKQPRRDNTTGVTGVYWNKRASVWTAAICVAGKLKHLGRFADKDAAIAARRAAESAL